MRRPTVVLILMAVMVALLAGVAYAATIEGTANDDILRESQRNDQMYGFEGEDDLLADFDGADTDVLRGGRGPDNLIASDGDGRDSLFGSRGYDRCQIDLNDDTSGCNETLVIVP
jgi:Ca2+-binding RTX toxin-like protein